jgi:very-short-patch-repair endonuclease
LRFELDTVLHVSVPPPKHAPRTTGVRGHQRRTGFMPIMRDRLRIASPADTWCDLGEQLTVPDLIAAGDFIVTGNPYAKILPLATLEELELALRRRDGARGSTACRRALPDICDGPLSRPETLLRLLLRDARLPTPQVNLSVHDDRGSFLALPDLAWPEYKFVVEYEGDHHRRIAQFRDDIRRVERLVDYDWVVMKVSADDVFDRSRELVERVVRRLARRGWVPRGIRLPQNGKYER